MTSWQWIIAALAAGVIEIFSLGFWFLWLAISALLVALGVSLGWLSSLESQLLVFALFTLLFIIFTRPLVLKLFKTHDTVSNVKAIIGEHGVVIKNIEPLHYGQVKVRGETWTAVADEKIEADERVIVTGIDGVKLLVEKAPV